MAEHGKNANKKYFANKKTWGQSLHRYYKQVIYYNFYLTQSLPLSQ
jgi:hypothetical protein